jgi:hypothetical protein
MVDIYQPFYGRVDEQTGALQLADGASATTYDVVDELMGRAILYGGKVVGVRRDDLPDSNSPVAALLRYAL